MRSLSACLTCCVALAAIASPTQAQQPTDSTFGTVVTLAPGGDASDTQKERALRALEESIFDSGLNALFVAALASSVGNRRLAKCQESDCALRAASRHDASAIAGVSVWKKGRSRVQTTLTITWRDLSDVGSAEQFTDIPLIGSLTIEEAVASGVTRFLTVDDDSIAVTIDSDPQGAAATIDGKPLGKTPLEVRLVPGGHELTLMLDDRYQPARQAIMVAATSTRFEIPLERKVELMAATEPVDAEVDEVSALNPILGTTLLVVGAGLMAYGIYALAEHGNKEVVESGSALEQRNTDSADMGVGLMIAGGVSAAAGGVILFAQPF